MTITFTNHPRRRRLPISDRANPRDPSLSILVASAIVPVLAVVVLGIASLFT